MMLENIKKKTFSMYSNKNLVKFSPNQVISIMKVFIMSSKNIEKLV